MIYSKQTNLIIYEIRTGPGGPARGAMRGHGGFRPVAREGVYQSNYSGRVRPGIAWRSTVCHSVV